MNFKFIEKTTFFIKKSLKDLFDPLKYKIADNVNSSELKEYYFLFDEEELLAGGSQDFHFDEEGIPVIPTYVDVDEKRMHYFPISIGQYGLAIYHTYLSTEDTQDKERFLKIVDWFSDNQTEEGTWTSSVPVPKFGLQSGWISSMAQSRGISILLRGYQLTEQEKYKQQAAKALQVFKQKVSEGGVRNTVKGNVFYEEYPGQPAPHVLNGMIFSLFGLYDYVRFVEDNQLASELFAIGIDSVKDLALEYDIGFWTKYDLYDQEREDKNINPATAHYHNIHIKQMMVLYKITNDEYFKQIIDKWQDYEKNKLNVLKSHFLKFKYLT